MNTTNKKELLAQFNRNNLIRFYISYGQLSFLCCGKRRWEPCGAKEALNESEQCKK
uniref:hypothetical protein n=1 Tax=Candidatus Fimivicinus sp. TaxID=3056640 RepID=UPI003FEDA8D5